MRIILEDTGANEASQARLLAMDQDSAKLTVAGLRAGAFGGGAFSAESLQEAIAEAGVEMAIEGSLAVHYLFACADASRHGGLAVRPFFREALGSGVASRMIAMARGIDSRTGFAIGLLHDVGRLALAALHGPAYREVDAEGGPPAEREALGLDHTQAGLALLIDRAFPPMVCEAAAFHHGQAEKISLVARIASAASSYSKDPRGRVASGKAVSWIGLSSQDADAVGEETARAVESASRLFG